MQPLFVVILRYLQTDAVIDPIRAEHRAFLDKQYANGTFIASGIQTPGNGGIILAQNIDRKTLTTRLHEDPFYQHQCAEYQIFEFTPTKYTDNFKKAIQ